MAQGARSHHHGDLRQRVALPVAHRSGRQKAALPDEEQGAQHEAPPLCAAARESQPRHHQHDLPAGSGQLRGRVLNKPLAAAALPRVWNEYERPHADLREALERIERAGELLRIKGADCKLEMGTLAEIVYRQESPPAILYEDIPGYPKGYRAISGTTNSAKRLAIVLGFAPPEHPLDVVRAYRDRMKSHKPIPPRVVKDGPVLENVLTGKDIDVLKFPAPLLHEHDGGRYLGTDDLVIMRDPDEGWVNAATYRSMVQGPDRVGLWISPGKHGRQIREKYWRDGKPCPVLISCGHDPLLFLAGGNEIRYGLSEYDYAAGHRGAPYDVIESELY